jgi:WhiB family redox-sensing transcriptional regulator
MQPDPAGLDLPDLAGLIDRPEWFRRAACRGMGTGQFFPSRGGTGQPARAICSTCPVRSECLDYAMGQADTVGVWGGLSAKERARMRRAVA